jgi:hypothetical protein
VRTPTTRDEREQLLARERDVRHALIILEAVDGGGESAGDGRPIAMTIDAGNPARRTIPVWADGRDHLGASADGVLRATRTSLCDIERAVWAEGKAAWKLKARREHRWCPGDARL